MSRVLTMSDLRISTGERALVHGLDLTIDRGERVGLIGESGSGKSLTCLSIMGLLPETLTTSGEIVLEGEGDLTTMSERRLAHLRGRRVSMVFQEPMTALNPLMRVGDQIAEAVTLHQPRGASGDLELTVREALAGVQLPDPARLARAFPHELSGGQRQRVMLAMAMVNTPDLLLADEPTTALDVTVQNQVLDLMRAKVTQAESSLLFITHDLAVVAEICERVVIMRGGEVVEQGSLDRVFSAPQHPYTRGLLAASALETDPVTNRLVTVIDLAGGGVADEVVVEDVVVADAVEGEAVVEDVVVADAVEGEAVVEDVVVDLVPAEPVLVAVPVVDHQPRYDVPHDALVDGETSWVFNRTRAGEAPAPAIEVTELTRQYIRTSGPFSGREIVHGLRGVSFDVQEGQSFGIVGESGCGKSTLLRILTGLDAATSGSVKITGREIVGRRERSLRWLRSTVQIVFQDPMGSLDPKMRVADIIAEPLRGVSRDERHTRAADLLEAVGLPRAAADRFPHQFSGGQRQRIAIARALIARPQVLVADEAVSALDVSVRASVLNLLTDLAQEYALTLVFVSHDLNVVRHACDTVAVMNAGSIVECGPVDAVFDDPRHPYTQALLAALPRLDRVRRSA